MRIGRKPIVTVLANDDEEDRLPACDASAGDSVL